MSKQMNRYQDFRKIATIFLSGLTGFLFALPLSFDQTGVARALIPLAGFIMGLLVGYRRRLSTLFFYFVIFATVTLSTLIYLNV